MSDFTIQATHLCRDFGSSRVVDRLSLSLRSGQILALVGPNGAGKTTFLKLLLGLLAPTEGSVTMLGEPCFPASPKVARRIATVLDTHEPPRGTRICDLLAMKAGTDHQFDSRRAAELIEQRGLNLKTTWHTLSKGEGRWVLSMVALASRPDVLIMDEPADGLDPSARRQLYALIREEVNRRHATVLITSHILSDVERVADEVAILHAGRLLLHDPLEDLREQVREVELSERLVPDQLPKEIELLGQKAAGETMLAWVRHHKSNAATLNEPSLPSELRRRPANLEQIYLALTEYRKQ